MVDPQSFLDLVVATARQNTLLQRRGKTQIQLPRSRAMQFLTLCTWLVKLSRIKAFRSYRPDRSFPAGLVTLPLRYTYSLIAITRQVKEPQFGCMSHQFQVFKRVEKETAKRLDSVRSRRFLHPFLEVSLGICAPPRVGGMGFC
jgi:hypothetical protein